jgi:DNA polymerase III alpha subunit
VARPICSLVCYVLGLSFVDPVQHRLPFSRFANPFRPNPPDVDIDVPSEAVETVFRSIHGEWGDRVARISTVTRYGVKSSLRQYVREDLGLTTVKEQDECLEKLLVQSTDGELNELFRSRLGQVRGLGLHGSGLVIAHEEIGRQYVLRRLESGLNQLRLDKRQISTVGHKKIDLLANGGLSQYADIIASIEGRGRVASTALASFGAQSGDSAVWRDLQDGHLLGLAFGESRLIIRAAQVIRPASLDEFAICLALIRPSAALMGQREEIFSLFRSNRNEFYRRRNDFLIFDDDVIDFIDDLLDCGEDRADHYRRGFQRKEEAVIGEFRDRLEETGRPVATTIARLQMHSAHSFCRGHALVLAQLVYCLAVERRRHPRIFWAATLRHHRGSYRRWVLLREALRSGIEPSELKLRPIPDRYSRCGSDVRSLVELAQNGFWSGKEFVPKCYFQSDPKTGTVVFMGLIACYRAISVSKRGQTSRAKRIHLTVGFDDGQLVDFEIIENARNAIACELEIKLKRHHYASGVAVRSPRDTLLVRSLNLI